MSNYNFNPTEGIMISAPNSPHSQLLLPRLHPSGRGGPGGSECRDWRHLFSLTGPGML